MDHKKFTANIRRFLSPEVQDEILRKKWEKADKICAVHIQYFEPAPDGDFEIMFMSHEEAEDVNSKQSSFGYVHILSLEAGVALAKQEECCGGSFALDELRRIFSVRPDLVSDDLEL